MKSSIQQTFNDVLFFASSPINEKQAFYLSPSQEKVLRKLIHYSNTYEDITFQSKDIAKHTFLSERTVQDNIEILIKKGYITTARDVYSSERGYASKRTIYINWSSMEAIFSIMEAYLAGEEIKPTEAPKKVSKVKEITPSVHDTPVKEEVNTVEAETINEAALAKAIETVKKINTEQFGGHFKDGYILPFAKKLIKYGSNELISEMQTMRR